MNHLNRLACWWFGCIPNWKYQPYIGDPRISCTRCNAPDTSYADQVGDTRHNRFKDHVARLIAPLHFRFDPERAGFKPRRRRGEVTHYVNGHYTATPCYEGLSIWGSNDDTPLYCGAWVPHNTVLAILRANRWEG